MTLPNGGPVTQTPTYRASRPQVVGAETPQNPFPIYLSGAVQKGFGRGSKDLGCPTGQPNHAYKQCNETDRGWIANLPDDSLPQMVDATPLGVYFGYAQVSACCSDHRVDGPSSGTLGEEQTEVHPMVMSLGRNPFYKNQKLTAVRHAVIAVIRSLRWRDTTSNCLPPCVSGRRKSTLCTPSTSTSTGTR